MFTSLKKITNDLYSLSLSAFLQFKTNENEIIFNLGSNKLVRNRRN